MLGEEQDGTNESTDTALPDDENSALTKKELKKKPKQKGDEKKIEKVTTSKLKGLKKGVAPMKPEYKLRTKKDLKTTKNDKNNYSKQDDRRIKTEKEHKKVPDIEGNIYLDNQNDHNEDAVTKTKMEIKKELRGLDKETRNNKSKLPSVSMEKERKKGVRKGGNTLERVLKCKPEKTKKERERFTDEIAPSRENSLNHSLTQSVVTSVIDHEEHEFESPERNFQVPSTRDEHQMVGAFRVGGHSEDTDIENRNSILQDAPLRGSIGPIEVEACLVDREAEEAIMRIAIEEELRAAQESEHQQAMDLQERAQKVRRRKLLCKFSMVATIIIIVVVAVSVVVSTTKKVDPDTTTKNDKTNDTPQTGGRWIQIGNDIVFHSRRFGSDSDDSNQMGETPIKLSADGHRLAVSVPFEDKGFFMDNGRVEVDELADNWERIGKPITDAPFALGSMIDLSADGNFVALARASLTPSCEQPSDSFYFTKFVSVHHFDGSDWIQLGDEFYGMCCKWGITYLSISRDGSYIAASGQGAPVCVYEIKNGTWTQIGKCIEHGGGAWISLSGDGKRLVLNEASVSGQGSLYEFENGNWSKLQTFPGVETTIAETIVDLSDDGDVVATGSASSDIMTNSWSEQLEDFAVVYFQNFSSYNTWNRRGSNIINIETFLGNVPGPSRGSMMALSGDGYSLAISYTLKEGKKNKLIIGVARYSDLPKKWILAADVIEWPEYFSEDDFVPFLSLSHDGKRLAVSVIGTIRIYKWESKN